MPHPHVLHPVGFYDGTVIDHGLSFTKGGLAQVWVKFDTGSGFVTYFGGLQGGGVEYTRTALKALGWEGRDLRELKDGTLLRDRKVRVGVKHRDWNGATRENVSIYSAREKATAEEFDFDAINAAFNGEPNTQKDDVPF